MLTCSAWICMPLVWAEKIEAMAKELFAGPGAVRKTLHKYTLAR